LLLFSLLSILIYNKLNAIYNQHLFHSPLAFKNQLEQGKLKFKTPVPSPRVPFIAASADKRMFMYGGWAAVPKGDSLYSHSPIHQFYYFITS